MSSRPPLARNGFRPALSCLETRDTPVTGFVASGAIAGGAPLVEVDRPDGSVLAQFQAFEPGFAGGVRVATGELDGNPNTVEVAAAAGPGGGPRIQVFAVDTATGAVNRLADFFVFDPTFRDGVRVAVGDVDGAPGGLDQIVAGADAGGGPRVRTFALANGTGVPLGGPLGDFFAFEPEFRGGVRVAVGDVDGDPTNGAELIVGAGLGGGPRVRVFRADGAVVRDDFALPPDVRTGVNVAFDAASGTVRADGLFDDFSQRNEALNAPIRAQLAAARAQALAQFLAANPGATASGFAFGGTPFQAGVVTGPGLAFSNGTTAPGVFSSGTTTGVSFSNGTTTGVPFSSATTAGVPFGSGTTTGVSFSNGTTTGVSFSNGATTGVSFSSNSTASGVFSSGTTTGVPFGSATTASGGVFGTTNTLPAIGMTVTTTGF